MKSIEWQKQIKLSQNIAFSFFIKLVFNFKSKAFKPRFLSLKRNFKQSLFLQNKLVQGNPPLRN